MEKLLSNEMTKYVMIVGGITLALTVLLARMIGKIKAAFLPYRKQTILYTIVALLFFAIIALLAHPAFIGSPTVTFIVLQGAFLLLGLAHVYFLPQNLKWSGTPKTFLLDIVFTLFLAALGSIAFLFVYQWIGKEAAIIGMTASVLFFVVPFLPHFLQLDLINTFILGKELNRGMNKKQFENCLSQKVILIFEKKI